ncbi:hypothetical protein BYT27DRAFT_7226058 [Phlegmacium glaucopus]|nr:hypothetical protein BYT27DRAFT_7226058 [Phlegmacium glaucopus]
MKMLVNPDNWEWKTKSKAIWEPAEDNWWDFCAEWYGAMESQFASLIDPKLPSLALAQKITKKAKDQTFKHYISSSIFVCNSYVMMFDTVWAKVIASQGRHRVIITSQPGTAMALKLMFNYYLLVQLLQQKQVVLFSPDGIWVNTIWVYFFCLNKVYVMEALAAWGAGASLPNPISSSNVFIWLLFDICEQKEPVSFLVNHLCFPTHNKLVQGLQYQDEYHSLVGALHKVYGSSPPNLNDPLDVYPSACVLLEEHYSQEDTLPLSPEDALNYLMDAAIDHFGYSAHDVFSAVFNYSAMTQLHKDTFDLKYTELQDAVSALCKNQSASHSISHQILTLHLVDQGPLKWVCWNVDFKPDCIARNMFQELGEAEDFIICQHINFFWRILEAGGLAGWLLEPLAHWYIENTTDSTWPLCKIVKLKSSDNLSTCLENNLYYIPGDPNFPLFDAFTIELDYAKKSAILWVLQSPGSAMGYQKIHKIIAILKDELQEDPPLKKSKMADGQATTTPLMQVHYPLVVPKDESQPQDLHWQLLKGWSQSQKNGKVYCLEVSLIVCSTTIKNVSSF